MTRWKMYTLLVSNKDTVVKSILRIFYFIFLYFLCLLQTTTNLLAPPLLTFGET